jgi:exopolysaccharide production protein ExoQ
MKSLRLTRASVDAQPDRGAQRPAGEAPSTWADRAGKLVTTVLVWALLFVMVRPEGLEYPTVQSSMTSDADPVSHTIWMLIFIVSAGLLLWRLARSLRLLRELNPFLIAALGLAAASVLWSVAPQFTITRVTRFATVMMVGMCLALFGWTPGRFGQIMRSALTVICGASILMVWLDPLHAIHQSDQLDMKGAWYGITLGKNVLGSLAGSAVLVWLHGILTKETRLICGLAGLCLGLACLLGSRSSTSIMDATFAAIFMLLLMKPPGALKRSMPFLVGAFAAVVLVYALAVLDLVPGLSSLLLPVEALTGKDLSFSGRRNIWFILIDQIHQHPWFGLGFGAYWTGAVPSSPSYEMLWRLWFYPSEGHNGYLDVINELGWAGGLLLFGYFIRYLRDALKLMRTQPQLAALYLALVFRGFIADMSESHWFSPLTVDFVIMTLATCTLARSMLQTGREAKVAMGAPGARKPLANAAPPRSLLPGQRRGRPGIHGARPPPRASLNRIRNS